MTDLSDLGSSAFWRVNPRDSIGRNARMARSVRRHGRGRRPRACDLSAAPAARSCAQAPRSVAAGAEHALSQHVGLADQPQFPGNLDVEQRLSAIVRWNALAMVVAPTAQPELGGHISSYASAADPVRGWFQPFFPRRRRRRSGGDLGLLLSAFRARRLCAGFSRRPAYRRSSNYRREAARPGGVSSSYPHPWLMPDFWQFPRAPWDSGRSPRSIRPALCATWRTAASMTAADRKVWAFLGDGEMDEPESLGAITLAVREGLDNLIFVVNCNLQRLDGPVRGNGSIIQELEATVRRRRLERHQVVVGSDWDPLFARDTTGCWCAPARNVDGEFRRTGHRRRLTAQHFFNKYPELRELVAHCPTTISTVWPRRPRPARRSTRPTAAAGPPASPP